MTKKKLIIAAVVSTIFVVIVAVLGVMVVMSQIQDPYMEAFKDVYGG